MIDFDWILEISFLRSRTTLFEKEYSVQQIEKKSKFFYHRLTTLSFFWKFRLIFNVNSTFFTVVYRSLSKVFLQIEKNLNSFIVVYGQLFLFFEYSVLFPVFIRYSSQSSFVNNSLYSNIIDRHLLATLYLRIFSIIQKSALCERPRFLSFLKIISNSISTQSA